MGNGRVGGTHHGVLLGPMSAIRGCQHRAPPARGCLLLPLIQSDTDGFTCAAGGGGWCLVVVAHMPCMPLVVAAHLPCMPLVVAAHLPCMSVVAAHVPCMQLVVAAHLPCMPCGRDDGRCFWVLWNGEKNGWAPLCMAVAARGPRCR